MEVHIEACVGCDHNPSSQRSAPTYTLYNDTSSRNAKQIENSTKPRLWVCYYAAWYTHRPLLLFFDLITLSPWWICIFHFILPTINICHLPRGAHVFFRQLISFGSRYHQSSSTTPIYRYLHHPVEYISGTVIIKGKMLLPQDFHLSWKKMTQATKRITPKMAPISDRVTPVSLVMINIISLSQSTQSL